MKCYIDSDILLSLAVYSLIFRMISIRNFLFPFRYYLSVFLAWPVVRALWMWAYKNTVLKNIVKSNKEIVMETSLSLESHKYPVSVDINILNDIYSNL